MEAKVRKTQSIGPKACMFVLWSGLLIILSLGCDRQAPPQVVVSIPPIHSLASAIMEGVDEPLLLMDGRSSPHTFSLRPSDARAIAKARLLIWVGPGLESGLKKAIANKKSGKTLEVMRVAALNLLEMSGSDHPDGEHNHSSFENFDPHVWLSPQNAITIASEIEAALSKTDPANAAEYKRNAERLRGDLAKLDAELRKKLEPAGGRRYAVLHDAYRYFTSAMNLESAIVIKSRPDIPLGVQSLLASLKEIEQQDVACILIEPQSDADLARQISRQASLRVAKVDPMGAGLSPGPNHYRRTLLALADGIGACLIP